MRTKKYWQKQSEEHYRNLQEARDIIDHKDQALNFLLECPDAYRVKLTSDCNCYGYSPERTVFEYVDQYGKYHHHRRQIRRDSIEIISTNAETAIFKREIAEGKYTYWILNKATETIAEIPEDYFCTNRRGNFKTCEIKACEIKGED